MDVLVKRREDKGSECLLSANLFDELGLVEDKEYTLHVGHSSATVTIRKSQGKKKAGYRSRQRFFSNCFCRKKCP